MFKRLSLLTFKEFIQLLVYKLGAKLVDASNYKIRCEPVRDEIRELLEMGLSVSRKQGLICINGASPKDDYRYLIRPLTSDKKVFKQVVLNNEYSPIVELVKEKQGLDTVKTIVDAGSNIGLTALYLNRFFPRANIIAIEPDDENFKQLASNIRINGLRNMVLPQKKALWINNTDKLSISSQFRDGESWSKSVAISKGGDNSLVDAITLSDVMQIGRVSKIDILKIDIEGAEVPLFDDGTFVSELSKSVKFMCLEIHDELASRQRIYDVLNEIKFSFSEIGETCFCFNEAFQ